MSQDQPVRRKRGSRLFPAQEIVQLSILRALQSLGDEGRPSDIYPLVTSELKAELTPHALEAQLKRGDNYWENYIRWQRESLLATGDITSPRHGIWRLTNKGKDSLTKGAVAIGSQDKDKNNSVDIGQDLLNGFENFATSGERPLDSHGLLEGNRIAISVDRAERNPHARQLCIEHYGPYCQACGFDFSEVYGGLGEGYIHVHHLSPISQATQQYVIDPISDLRPLCPNCHAMIHRVDPPMTIEDLQKLMKELGAL